jgi:hypothetical protein
VEHLQEEVAKLQTFRTISVPTEACATTPSKVLQILKRRATNDRAGSGGRRRPHDVGNHPPYRDADREAPPQGAAPRHHASSKEGAALPFRVAEAVVAELEGATCDVLFPRVTEETFRNSVTEGERSSVPQLVSI